MIGASSSSSRGRRPGDGFVDAVTFSLGDPGARALRAGAHRALGRAGRARWRCCSPGASRSPRPRATALPADGAGWTEVDLGGVATAVRAPLERWTVRFASEDGRHGFELSSRRPSQPADARRVGRRARAAWRATSSSATCTGRRPSTARAQRGRAASASAATPGARRTGRGSRSRARSTAWPEGGPASRSARSGRRAPPTTPRRRLGGAARRPRRSSASTTRGSRRRTTTTATSAAPASSCGSARTTTYPRARLRRGAVRLDARARRAAARLRVLALAHGGPRGRRPLRPPAPRMIEALISDFGGVLTSPLLRRSRAVQRRISTCRRGLRPTRWRAA